MRSAGYELVGMGFRWAAAFAVFGIGVGAVAPGRAAGSAERVPDRAVAAMLGDYLSRAEAAGFSGTVVITQGGTPIIQRGLGSSTCNDRGPRLTLDTGFYLASLSKSFTAAAILKLADQGRLHLEDPIGRFVADVPADKTSITVHELLSHASGFGELPRAAEERAVTREQFEREAMAVPLQSPPGQKYLYSNLGYGLLAAIVEHASGASFTRFVRTSLLEPAGLAHTWYVTEDSPTGSVMATACNGGVAQGTASLTHQRPFRWSAVGAVGLISTASDLDRWTHALLTHRVLSADSVTRMFTNQKDGYGYGWVVADSPTGRSYTHNGLLLPEGWNTDVHILPDLDTTVIVLANRYDDQPIGWNVSLGLLHLLEGGTVQMPVRPFVLPVADLARLSGDYDVEGGGQIRLSTLEHGWRLEPVGQRAVEALLGIAPARSQGLVDAARRSQQLLDASVSHALATLDPNITGRPSSEWLPGVQSTFDYLEGRFGALEKAEVRHAVPAPSGDHAAAVFATLTFAKTTTLVRLIWDSGRFQRMSDKGAFIGAAPGAALVPAPQYVVPTGVNTFAGVRLSTGQTFSGRFTTSAGGCRSLSLSGADGPAIVARRRDTCGG